MTLFFVLIYYACAYGNNRDRYDNYISLKSSGSQDPCYNLDGCWVCFNVTKSNTETNGTGGDIGPLK